MPLIIEQFLYELRERFLLRWVLANIVGWMIGLYAGVLNPICFAGAGVIAGEAVEIHWAGSVRWGRLRATGDRPQVRTRRRS